MKRRCYSPSNKGYKDYGGRGIGICDRWRNSLAAFHADMGDMPDGLTIDRIDNDRDYEPGNCRWSTYGEQARNTRRNRMYTCYGKTQCLTAWCLEYSMGFCCMRSRLERMTIKEALEIPKHAYKTSVIYEMDGRRQTLGSWCKELGVVRQACAWTRINKLGWTFERAVTTPVRH